MAAQNIPGLPLPPVLQQQQSPGQHFSRPTPSQEQRTSASLEMAHSRRFAARGDESIGGAPYAAARPAQDDEAATPLLLRGTTGGRGDGGNAASQQQGDAAAVTLPVGPGDDDDDGGGGGDGMPTAADDAIRRRRALQFCFVHIAFHVLFLCILGATLYVAPPWQHPECPWRQRIWAPVWCGLMGLHAGLLAVGLVARCGIGPPALTRCAKALVITQRVMRLMSTVWFFLGLRPLFWDTPCYTAARTFGRVLWYAHATAYLLPLFLYLGICLCFPCIVLAVNRLRPPVPNENPTPPEILAKIEQMEFRKFVDTCRQRGHPVHVEAGAFVTEPLRNNPLVEGLAGEADDSVRVDKACPICMADFGETEIIAQMPCDFRHIFHAECVKEWLATSQRCPICRANVVDLLQQPRATTGGNC